MLENLKVKKKKLANKDICKSQKGITLIALVITIIVLLILAAVSIATLTGQNGILTQANNAKTRTAEAQVNEEIKLAYNSVQTDSLINGWDINKKAEELQKELQKEDSSATVTVDGTNMNVSYKNYETTISEDGTIGELAKAKIIINEFKISGTKVTNPPVPTGFVHVGGTIDEGYVISDNANDVDKGSDSTELLGNQFVWVPVDKDQKIKINVTSEEEITSIVLTDPYGDDLTIPAASGKEYNEEITPTINGKYKIKVTTSSGTEKEQKLDVYSLYATRMWEIDMYTSDEYAQALRFENALQLVQTELGVSSIEEAEQMIISIYKEGTFAETEDYADKVNSNGGFYIGRYEAGDSSATENRTSATEGTLVTQKDKYVYNYISQTDALSKAKEYNTNLSSSLLTGAAWDRTLGWLYETEEKTGAEILADSKSWGNYYDDTFSNTTGLIKTGEYEQTKAKNIYDLAGNVSEWTTESCNTAYRFGRGGCSNDNDEARYPASYGYDYDPSSANSRLGFRVALFM